jgi:5-hydroxyisourate hydrolase
MNGVAATKVQIILYKQSQSDWVFMNTEETNEDGRCVCLLTTLERAHYKLTFDIKSYFNRYGINPFFPIAEVVFEVSDLSRHYHVPLVITPYSYNTYRGT